VYVYDGLATFNQTVIAGNTAGSSGTDIYLNFYSYSNPPTTYNGAVSANYSLIGNKAGTSLAEAPVGSPDANGNLIGGPVSGTINALLGPLAYNGGPAFLDGTYVLTTVPFVGSPAINTGSPAAVAGIDVPLLDQRGASRIANGRIDIGAVESHPYDYN